MKKNYIAIINDALQNHNTTYIPLEVIRYGQINTAKKLIKMGYSKFDYRYNKPMSGTNLSLYRYLMGFLKHSKRQRLKMYYLLIQHGLDTSKPWREFYRDIDPKNNLIIKIWNELFKKRCFDICIALHQLELPALQMIEICKATHPYSVIIPFHMFWDMVTIIKHFKNK